MADLLRGKSVNSLSQCIVNSLYDYFPACFFFFPACFVNKRGGFVNKRGIIKEDNTWKQKFHPKKPKYDGHECFPVGLCS